MRQILIPIALVTYLITTAVPVWTQDLASIKQSLEARYALTITTADKSDIVTPGAVLMLKKSGLVTVDVKSKNLYQNSYKNGRITQNAIGNLNKFLRKIPGAADVSSPERTFVSGEKIWLTAIDVRESGVVLSLFTDAYGDTRYEATLTFPFEKYQTPTAGVAMAQVAAVFGIQPSEDAKQQQPQTPGGGSRTARAMPAPPGPQPSSQVEAPPPPIAPPPPPPAEPKTIALGQTVDQVTANFGQPTKVIKLSSKQIYVYPDMKVVFIGGKVTDVQ